MKNIKLISASAGSGKTYTLMLLLHESLTKKGLTPDQVIAMTFTKDAALEISERARKKLVEEGEIDLALQISAAKIGTIDSVCRLLLEMFSFDEGVSPRQNVLAEEEGNLLFESCFNQYLDQDEYVKLRDDASDFDLDEKQIRENIKSLSSEMRSQNLSREDKEISLEKALALFRETFPVASDGKAMNQRLQQAVDNWKISGHVPTDKKNSINPFQKMTELHRIGVEALIWKDWLDLAGMTDDIAVKERPLYSPIIDAASDFHSHGLFHARYEAFITKIYDIAFNITQAYQDKKISQGVLDFVDMELRFLKLLDRPTVRSRIKEQFKLIMVDEFQDTSPIQLAIFLKLSHLVDEMVWVGDPKQCIFAFRGADPVLMKTILEKLPKENISYLETSYRSKTDLVKVLSDAFVDTFKEDGLTEQEVRLKEDKKTQEKLKYQGPTFEHWALKGNQFVGVAQQVVALLKSDKTLKPADIAVLCPKNDDCKAIAEALSELGIESSYANIDLKHSQDVQILMAIYQSIATYDNKLAEAEIFTMLNGTLTIPNGTNTHPWSEFISEKRQHKAGLHPSGLINAILIEGKLLDTIERLESSERRLKNIKVVQQLALEYEGMCLNMATPCTLVGFLDFMDSIPEKRRFDSEKGKSRNENIIDIKTFHGSKGLEWKITIVFGLDGNIDVRNPLFGKMVTFDRAKFDPENCLKDRYVIQLIWPFGNNKPRPALNATMMMHALYQERVVENRQERKRVLYVAMTRAKESLIIPVKEDSRTPGYFSLLPAFTLPTKALRPYSGETLTRTDNVVFKYVEPLKFAELPLYVNPSSFEEVESTDAPKTTGLTIYGGALKISKSYIDDTANFGHFIHAFLAGEQTADSLKACAKTWGYDISEYVDAFLKMSSDFDAKLPVDSKTRIIAEFPLVLPWDEHQILRGAIDLVLIKDDEILIFDHKTSQIEAKDADWKAKTHGVQLKLYKKSIEQMYPGKKVRTFLNYPLAGFYFEVLL